MHCPNCGKAATAEQQFCRACGMSLDSVGKLVAQHSSSLTPSQIKLEKARAEQEIVRRMFTSIMIGMIILGIGVVMIVLNKTFDFGTAFRLVSSLLLIGGTGFATFAVLNAVRKGASLPASPVTKELPTSAERSLPAERFEESPPSVTERTTQLISAQRDE